MNLTCGGHLELKCNNCGHIITINCSNLPFDVVETEQRQMGAENTHSADYEFGCPKCGNEISIKYDVWEYPEGAINDKNIEITGGKLILECDCEMTE